MKGLKRRLLDLVDQAQSARARLEDPRDEQALHDLRVALRRLLTCLDAFPRLVDAPQGRLRKSLRRILSATGPGRDAEVMLAWVSRSLARPSPRQKPGTDRLRWTLQERRRRGHEDAVAGADARLEQLAEDLRRGLESGGDGHPRRWSRRAGRKLEERADKLARLLERGLASPKRAHKFRLGVKKARYLLEPFAGEPSCRRPLEELKSLQDILGELHDRTVLAAETSAEAAGLPRGNPEREGLLEAARRLGVEEKRLSGRARAWLARRRRFLTGLSELGRDLSRR